MILTQAELTPRAGQILRALRLPFSSLEPVESYSSVVLRSTDLIADPGRCQEILDAALAWARAYEPLLPR